MWNDLGSSHFIFKNVNSSTSDKKILMRIHPSYQSNFINLVSWRKFKLILRRGKWEKLIGNLGTSRTKKVSKLTRFYNSVLENVCIEFMYTSFNLNSKAFP